MKIEAQHDVEQRLPGQNLLLALLRGPKEEQDRAEILSLLRQVNWPRFFGNTSEDLYPYVAFALEPYIALLEEAPEIERLFKARRLTAVQNLLLRHELGRALEALRQSGLLALALKGVVMAYTAYPDPSLRPMTDLDLLVPPGKREDAICVLRKLGYEYPESLLATHRDHIWRLGPNQEFAPPLRLRSSSVLLEVHSQLECSEPAFPISAHELWCRSVAVDLRGLRVRTLCPEDFLFHLCLHQSRHHRFEKGLLPLVDLKLLLESRSDWNWAGIAERSLRCGFANWMYLTLEAARDLVGAPVPDSFLHALPSPRDLSQLRRLAEEQVWSARAKRDLIPMFLPTLFAERSWQNRARMFVTRMRLVSQGELHSERTVARLAERARLTLRRLLATLRSRIPNYVDAWKTGNLKFRAIRRSAMLLRKANTLFRLAEQDTVGAPRKPVSERVRL